MRGYRPEDLKRYERWKERWRPKLAYALIANTIAGGSASGVTTSGIDTSGADFIVVNVAWDAGAATPSITDSNSNSWTILNIYTAATHKSAMWYKQAPTVGAAHTFTASGTNVYPSMGVLAFSGSVASPFDQQNGANDSSTTLATGSITPTENNELIVTGFGIFNPGTPVSIDSGFTLVDSINFSSGNYYGSATAYLIQTTASAVNPTWTRTNSNHMTASIASFKAAAAGGAGPLLRGGSLTHGALIRGGRMVG